MTIFHVNYLPNANLFLLYFRVVYPQVIGALEKGQLAVLRFFFFAIVWYF